MFLYESRTLVEVPDLHLHKPLPDPTDPRIGLMLSVGVVEVRLVELDQRQLLKHRLPWIAEELVLRHMLLLDLSNLSVELSRNIVRVHEPMCPVKEHRLLLSGDDRDIIHLRLDISRIFIVVFPHRVIGVAVLDARRSARFHVGPALDDHVRVTALDVVVETAVAVEVIEILQQRKIQRLSDVGVWFVLRQVRGKIDRHLLISDRGLDDRLIGRVEHVDRHLLLRIDPPYLGHRPLHLRIRMHPGDSM